MQDSCIKFSINDEVKLEIIGFCKLTVLFFRIFASNNKLRRESIKVNTLVKDNEKIIFILKFLKVPFLLKRF